MPNSLCSLLYVVACMRGGASAAQNPWGFEAVVNALTPSDVDTVSSVVLREWLKDDKVVLLDTRSREEFRVSHLPSARFVGYESFALDSISDLDKNDTVVLSCAVGSRSGKIAELLRHAGYRHVYNHYGGIFDWTNRGYKVFDASDESVRRVHPYNRLWSIWIENYDEAYEP